jgi:hypothetical protein
VRWLRAGGVLGVKKVGRALSRTGEIFPGVGKLYWFPLARNKPEIHFSTPEAGLSGQKLIKRTQKYVV